MNKRKLWRWALLIAAVLAFGLTAFASVRNKRRTCLGVRILPKEKTDQYTEYTYWDDSATLRYNDQPAPVDLGSSTLYLAVDLTPGMKPYELAGKLSNGAARHDIFFLADDAFSDLSAAVAEGHRFHLLVTDGSACYMQYDVIFTTLPVLAFDGPVVSKDEKNRDVHEGSFCAWTPCDPDTGRYSVKSSRVQWHHRGGTSASYPKKSWKLSLKNKKGQSKNLALLGLGSDDDWILNSTNMDDTHMKEKLAADLWNAFSEENPGDYPMSQGEFVEIVVNGRYYGVYLLQRRVDAKYLSLDKSRDILLKGRSVWKAETPQKAYEIVSSPLSDEETFAVVEQVWQDYGAIDLDNFIDLSLLVQYGAMSDNTGFKNTYYLIRRDEAGYHFSLIPWDTDMSFGVTWIESFAYDYQRSLDKVMYRREYKGLRELYPDLDARVAARWAELRKDTLSWDSICTRLDQMEESLISSGAFARDEQRWGTRYGGADTPEALRRYLEERLQKLDTLYGEAAAEAS